MVFSSNCYNFSADSEYNASLATSRSTAALCCVLASRASSQRLSGLLLVLLVSSSLSVKKWHRVVVGLWCLGAWLAAVAEVSTPHIRWFSGEYACVLLGLDVDAGVEDVR